MAIVRMETIVSMTNELNNFKQQLVLALSTGTQLPNTNSEIILNKYIGVATKELSITMPTKTANKMARNILTSIMLEVMGE